MAQHCTCGNPALGALGYLHLAYMAHRIMWLAASVHAEHAVRRPDAPCLPKPCWRLLALILLVIPAKAGTQGLCCRLTFSQRQTA